MANDLGPQVHTIRADVTDARAARNDAQKHGAKFRILEHRGPGGGNPLVEVSAHPHVVKKLMKKWGHNHDSVEHEPFAKKYSGSYEDHPSQHAEAPQFAVGRLHAGSTIRHNTFMNLLRQHAGKMHGKSGGFSLPSAHVQSFHKKARAAGFDYGTHYSGLTGGHGATQHGESPEHDLDYGKPRGTSAKSSQHAELPASYAKLPGQRLAGAVMAVTQHSETMQFSVRSFKISKKVHHLLAKHGYVDAEYKGEDATSHSYQHPHGHEVWVSAGSKWSHAAHDHAKGDYEPGSPTGHIASGSGHDALAKHLHAFHTAPERKHEKVVNHSPGAGYGFGGDGYDNPHHVRDMLKRTPSSQ